MDDCEKEEGPIIQAILAELGYPFTLEDACEFWGDLSWESSSANWLGVKDHSDTWRQRRKDHIRYYIRNTRANALTTLLRFPQEPRA